MPELTTSPPVGAGRVALVLEYDGSRFHGWQFQKSGIPSVAGDLARAVAHVADHPVDLVCAGRTDAGVHASYQVVHFDTPVNRSLRAWVLGINSALPADISVHWAGNVPESFHARFSARSRRYRYLIFNHSVRPALYRDQVSWNFRPLDAERMAEAAGCLIGEHDFSSFRAAGCQSNSPNRFVSAIQVSRRGPFVLIDIQANAFLHHMVRNIAGSLMAVGSGRESIAWLQEVLESRDRTRAAVTAPASGLYLVDVQYPEHPEIPRPAIGPTLLQGWGGDTAVTGGARVEQGDPVA